MGLRTLNPTTPGVRGRIAPDFSELTKGNEPLKSLTAAKPSPAGRNHFGRITSRFRGGGHKRRFRTIDFRRDKIGVPAKVATIEYDPNRTARIALLHYVDGEKRYILCPDGLRVGDTVLSSRNADIKPGNNLPLRFIPLGTTIHNIEHASVHVGKAGRTRWKGRRPHNRGVTMNPVDHPMGGGEGRSSGGRHPCSPWGMPTKGYKTRSTKRTDKMIVRRRGEKG